MYHLHQVCPTVWEIDIYDNDFDTAYEHLHATVIEWIRDNKSTFNDIVKYDIIHTSAMFDPHSVKKNAGLEVARFPTETVNSTRYIFQFTSEKDSMRFKVVFGGTGWYDNFANNSD